MEQQEMDRFFNFITDAKVLIFSILLITGVVLLLGYLLDQYAMPLEGYGMLVIGGRETNFTQYAGGKEMFIALEEYTKNGVVRRNATVLVDYKKLNSTALFSYTKLRNQDGAFMTDKGGLVHNKIVFDMVKTLQNNYGAVLALEVNLLLFIAYALPNRLYGYKLGQSMLRRRKLR